MNMLDLLIIRDDARDALAKAHAATVAATDAADLAAARLLEAAKANDTADAILTEYAEAQGRMVSQVSKVLN